jgi:hypothetical protein
MVSAPAPRLYDAGAFSKKQTLYQQRERFVNA